MKILYHHRTASRDGQSTHIEEMIAALRAVGCTVEECAPSVTEVDNSGGSPGWVGALKRWLPRPAYEVAELAYSLLAYRRLSAHIVAFTPDAVYERYNLYLLAGVLAKRRRRVPLILEVNAPMAVERRKYGGLSFPWLADWAEHYVWRHADAVLPVSHVLAQHLIDVGVEPKRIRVVPNGINPDHYRELPSREQAKRNLNLDGKLVIGFVGFVREWDQLDRIVHWIARYEGSGPQPHLLVVGDGPARQFIEKEAKHFGLSDQVTFTGAVERKLVPGLASAFDIALQTALVPYASPLCLFEYLALEKAILAPDQPNHHEILRHGESAWLYDPASPTGLERGLDELSANEALRVRIAAGAGRLIESKRLTWKNHASTVLGIVSSVRASAGGEISEVVPVNKG